VKINTFFGALSALGFVPFKEVSRRNNASMMLYVIYEFSNTYVEKLYGIRTGKADT